MVERVYLTDSNKATFICPQCENMKTVDVSKLVCTSNVIKVNSKCSCGHKWTSVFEKRKQFRKMVNFTGTYDYIKDEKVVDRGGMKVVDLSGGGVKVQLNVERNLQVGDHLNLEFHLDDNNRTLIEKRVTIRTVSGVYLGTTFGSANDIGPELGFYLMR
jgi:hypothetical protein